MTEKKLDEDMELFLEWFEDQCKKRNGKIKEKVDTFPDGGIEKTVECIFSTPPILDVEVYGYKRPDPEWAVAICFGVGECSRVRDLARVNVAPDVFISSEMRGFASFSGMWNGESYTRFSFGERDRLKRVRLVFYRPARMIPARTMLVQFIQ